MSNTLNEVNAMLDDTNVEVKLIWLPSHVGIAGNETVDQLAQFASTACVATSLELKDMFIKVQEYIMSKWQHLWQSSNTGKFYRKVESNVSYTIKYENSVRAKEMMITRLRLGTCLTNEYLKKINVAASDKCQICTKHVETIEHIVLGCAKSDLCNKVLNDCAVLNVSPQLDSAVGYAYMHICAFDWYQNHRSLASTGIRKVASALTYSGRT